MTKKEFLSRIRSGLGGLPKDEIEQRVSFYEEIIDDKIEEGLSEERAVESLGGVDSVIDNILSEIPLTSFIKRTIKPKRRMSALEITLVVVGSPIWLSILVSILAIAFSIYATVWAVIASLLAVGVSFSISLIAGVVMLFVYIATGNTAVGFFMLGAGLLLGGLSVFIYVLSVRLVKATLRITVGIPTWIKHRFIGKERKNEEN